MFFFVLGNGILFLYFGLDLYVIKIVLKRMSFFIEIEWSVWMVFFGFLCVCLSGLNYIKYGFILMIYYYILKILVYWLNKKYFVEVI